MDAQFYGDMSPSGSSQIWSRQNQLIAGDVIKQINASDSDFLTMLDAELRQTEENVKEMNKRFNKKMQQIKVQSETRKHSRSHSRQSNASPLSASRTTLKRKGSPTGSQANPYGN